MTIKTSKNTFHNGGNNRHGLKNVTCKQTFRSWVMLPGDVTLPDLTTGFFATFAHFTELYLYPSGTPQLLFALFGEKSSQARNYTFCVVIYSIFLTVFNHVFHISVLGLEGLGLDSDSLDIKDLNQLEAIINGNFDGNFDFQL